MMEKGKMSQRNFLSFGKTFLKSWNNCNFPHRLLRSLCRVSAGIVIFGLHYHAKDGCLYNRRITLQGGFGRLNKTVVRSTDCDV